MIDFDQRLEDALKRRAAMQAPPQFTSAVMRLVRRETVFKKEPGPFLARAAWLNDAAFVLIIVGLSLAWNPARLSEKLTAGVDWLVKGVDAVGGMAAGVNPSAPFVVAALTVWVAGMLLWDWMELSN